MDALSSFGLISSLSRIFPNFRLVHWLGTVDGGFVFDGAMLTNVGDQTESRYEHALNTWKAGVLAPAFQWRNPHQTESLPVGDTITFINPARITYKSYETINSAYKDVTLDMRTSLTAFYQTIIPGPAYVSVFLFTWD